MSISIRFTALLFLVCLALPACGTFQGMGQDIQSAGQAVERTATRTSPYDHSDQQN